MTGPFVVKLLETREAYERRRGGDPEAYRQQGVFSVRAFETLEKAAVLSDDDREVVAEALRLTPDGHPPRVTLRLPDGREIVVEATTYHELWKQVDHERWFAGPPACAEEDAALLLAFNAAMAERHGTEGRA